MRLARLIFAIWVFFWVFFLARGLYKGRFEKYKALLLRSPEARRAYIIGEDLYKFLKFSFKNVSKEGTYQMVGNLKPIDRYRLIYYLYPRRESDNPEYILCYKTDKDYDQRGYYRFVTLEKDQFILRKKGMH